MKRISVFVGVITLVAVLFSVVQFSESSCPHVTGQCPDDKKLSKNDEETYQKSITEAHKLMEEKKDKDAEVAVEEALKVKPGDPIASALKSRITHKVKGMTYSGINDQGYQEYTHKQTGLKFILIPGGRLIIEGSEGQNGKKRIDDMTVRDFMLSKYEVPQGVWEKTMKNNPSNFKKGENYPVEQVTWEDCKEFCKKTDLRMPEEIEWEYACRFNTTTRYYWGNNENGDFLWYAKNSADTTHENGKKKPNGYGLYDMLGNVWEWCRNPYKENKKENDPKKIDGDPGDPKYRALRSGAWDQAIENCGSSSYLRLAPDTKQKNIGFRPASDARP
ncbi:MAG: formylglycine-generating enzyme family protein [Candidatus Brocadiia bacterium]